jgi:hypothetical protein
VTIEAEKPTGQSPKEETPKEEIKESQNEHTPQEEIKETVFQEEALLVANKPNVVDEPDVDEETGVNEEHATISKPSKPDCCKWVQKSMSTYGLSSILTNWTSPTLLDQCHLKDDVLWKRYLES